MFKSTFIAFKMGLEQRIKARKANPKRPIFTTPELTVTNESNKQKSNIKQG